MKTSLETEDIENHEKKIKILIYDIGDRMRLQDIKFFRNDTVIKQRKTDLGNIITNMENEQISNIDLDSPDVRIADTEILKTDETYTIQSGRKAAESEVVGKRHSGRKAADSEVVGKRHSDRIKERMAVFLVLMIAQ